MTDLVDAIASALAARSNYNDAGRKLEELIGIAAIYDATIANCACDTRRSELLGMISINNLAIDKQQNELYDRSLLYNTANDIVTQMVKLAATATAKDIAIHAMGATVIAHATADAKVKAYTLIAAEASAEYVKASAEYTKASAEYTKASAKYTKASDNLLEICYNFTDTSFATAKANAEACNIIIVKAKAAVDKAKAAVDKAKAVVDKADADVAAAYSDADKAKLNTNKARLAYVKATKKCVASSTYPQ